MRAAVALIQLGDPTSAVEVLHPLAVLALAAKSYSPALLWTSHAEMSLGHVRAAEIRIAAALELQPTRRNVLCC
jgi:hypothetical protein